MSDIITFLVIFLPLIMSSKSSSSWSGIGARQVGQDGFFCSHGKIHLSWYKWLHGNSQTFSFDLNVTRHTVHSIDAFAWVFVMVAFGISWNWASVIAGGNSISSPNGMALRRLSIRLVRLFVEFIDAIIRFICELGYLIEILNILGQVRLNYENC